MNVLNWRPWPYSSGSVEPGTWLCTVIRYTGTEKVKLLETLRLLPDGTWVRPGDAPLKSNEAVRAFTWVDQDWVPDSIIEEGERNANAEKLVRLGTVQPAALSFNPEYSPWFPCGLRPPWEPGVYQVATIDRLSGEVVGKIMYRRFRPIGGSIGRWSFASLSPESVSDLAYVRIDNGTSLSWRGLAKPPT